ncbi:MAG: hypothetical protein JRD93_17845 [Deltaproteobacteria bacterium]|nr:hypothetical protein [Deltaproteobacteria bacterium]
MNDIEEDKQDTPKEVPKKIIAISVAILLGAIGSGVWDLFLRDLLLFCGRKTLMLLGSLYSADRLYRYTGQGDVDYFGMMPFVFLMMFVSVFPWYALISVYSSINEMQRKLNPDKAKARVRLARKKAR